MNLASWKKRAANFTIDTVCVLLLLIAVLRVLPFLLKLLPTIDRFEIGINVLLLPIMFIYYTFFEAITGKTIGKYLTGTRVVASDGKRVTLLKALVRSLVRFFLLELFSFCSRRPEGWHDRISNTKVVEDE